jgi:uncharacterized tellurite resistance protein B-like protein
VPGPIGVAPHITHPGPVGGRHMFDEIKRFFGKTPAAGSPSDHQASSHDIHVAVCALCIEIARIDEHFTPQELETVLSILKTKYQLSSEHAQALMASADKALEESVDLWQFARLINENYTPEEKIAIIEILWQIVYVDGKMDDHEHYLMNKLSNLLRLSHDQLIDAKLKVLKKK